MSYGRNLPAGLGSMSSWEGERCGFCGYVETVQEDPETGPSVVEEPVARVEIEDFAVTIAICADCAENASVHHASD